MRHSFERVLGNRCRFAFLAIAFLSSCGGEPNLTASQPQANSLQGAPAQTDVAVNLSGPRSNFTITATNSGFHIKDNVGDGGILVAGRNSVLHFSDVSINLSAERDATLLADGQLQKLIELYIAFFNRVPESDGLVYWANQVRAGMNIEDLSNNFYRAAIFYSASTGYSSSMSDEEFIRKIYKNVLGRDEVDAEGLQYWKKSLAEHSQTRATLINTILTSAHSFKGDKTYGWVADLLDNKIEVGRYVAVQQGLNYLTPEDSIAKTMRLVEQISPVDTSVAKRSVNPNDLSFDLSDHTSIPSASVATLSLDIPPLVQLEYNGKMLQGKPSILIGKGGTATFNIKVHPSFVWSNTDGTTYNNNTLQLNQAISTDSILKINSPTLQDSKQPILLSANYSRSAMFRDDVVSKGMDLRILAAVSKEYRVALRYTGLDPHTNAEVTKDLMLLDDGVGADSRMNDFIFSGHFATDLLPRYEYMGIAAYEGKVIVLDSVGNEVSSAGQIKTGMSMVVIDPVKRVAPTKIADDVYATTSVVNIVVPSTIYRFNRDPIMSSQSFTAMKRVLNFYPDVFDHASFFYAGDIGTNPNSEFSYLLQSKVTGIGDYSRFIYGVPASFGSKSLEAVSELTGGTTGPFMHEWTHRFGFFLTDSRLPMSESDGCHCHLDIWNQIIYDPISAGGGMQITQQNNGDWMLTSYHGEVSYRHSDIMLYLMGLLGPDQLPTQAWVIDSSGKLQPNQSIPSSKVKLISAKDIEGIYGQRLPAYGNAPTTFREAIVLISAGRPALPEEMSALELQAQFYSSESTKSANNERAGWQNGLGFYDSTRGRGHLITALPARK